MAMVMPLNGPPRITVMASRPKLRRMRLASSGRGTDPLEENVNNYLNITLEIYALAVCQLQSSDLLSSFSDPEG